MNYFLVSVLVIEISPQVEATPSPISGKAKRILQLRMKMQHLLKGYIDNLTIHGVTKIFKGAFMERLFWLAIFVGVLVYFFYSSHTLLMKYSSNDYVTNTETHTTH